ncbi:MAG: hypothetical protein D6800_13330 [Candidatus Zixiibacteriota bacterium]|nr:MAG: hypothetical protein D6800_13330 [candidate division Zixibacteria bacterium]
MSCGGALAKRGGVWVCPQCNVTDPVEVSPFVSTVDDDEHVFIECPGATLYAPGTTEITAGVKFVDDNDPSRGYTIVKHPVYAPTHRKYRRIKREAVGKIRRCEGCQDYTIRMRRPEGRDFYIPSAKHPGRKKLKAVTHRTTA